MEILFTWIQFLKETTVDFLGIQSPLLIARGGSKVLSDRTETDSTGTGAISPLSVQSFSLSCTSKIFNNQRSDYYFKHKKLFGVKVYIP